MAQEIYRERMRGLKRYTQRENERGQEIYRERTRWLKRYTERE